MAKLQIAVGLGSKVEKVPAGFNQDAVVVFGEGIGACWDRWGQRGGGSTTSGRPENDADPILKSFGYWTDNGADYYYNYDLGDGYAGTLLNVRRRYEQEGIPLGYLS